MVNEEPSLQDSLFICRCAHFDKRPALPLVEAEGSALFGREISMLVEAADGNAGLNGAAQ
jgi:hypothetical protein